MHSKWLPFVLVAAITGAAAAAGVLELELVRERGDVFLEGKRAYLAIDTTPPASFVSMPPLVIDADVDDDTVMLESVPLDSGGQEVLATFTVSNTTATAVSAAGEQPSSWQCSNATATQVFRVNQGDTATTNGIGPYCSSCALGQTFSVPTQKLFLLAVGAPANVQCARVRDGGAYPSSSGLSTGAADATYLRLDTSNDPLTGNLALAGSPGVASLQIRNNNAAGNGSVVSVGTAGNEYFGVYTSSLGVGGVGGVFIGLGQGVINVDGTQAAPSYSFATDLTTGMFRAGAGLIGWTIAGTNRLALSSSSLTGTNVSLWPQGGAGNPSYSFSNDVHSGMYLASASDLAFAVASTKLLDMTTGGLLFGVEAGPTSTGTTDLGDATHAWRQLFLTQQLTPTSGSLVVNGDISNISQSPGNVNTDKLTAAANDSSGVGANLSSATITAGADNAAVRVSLQSTLGSIADGSPWMSFRVGTGSGGNATGTELGAVRELLGGTQFWGQQHTAAIIDFGDTGLNLHRGTTPAAFPTCTTSLAGQIRYKEDTDTSATNSQLCLCARNNAALTYAWIPIGGTLSGTCT